MATKMEHKGYSARIMEAPRLTGDQIHGLPPGTPLEVYPADAFKKLPESWMKGAGVFIVPVKPNKGLWFDWRYNSEVNTAIIPTVKGCNPITGLQTSGFHLEKYEKKCPKHGCDFLAERFCPECNYKWPDRNYVSMSPSWWDGFRSEDGNVRQFFFSEDELRDIASHLIGKENTVPAFGFAFYSPKERRPEPQIRQIITEGFYHPEINPETLSFSKGCSGGELKGLLASYPPPGLYAGQVYYSNSSTEPISAQNYSCNEVKISGGNISSGMVCDSAPIPCAATIPSGSLISDGEPEIKRSRSLKSKTILESPCRMKRDFSTESVAKKSTPIKEVSIGAGAKIRQDLNQDPYPLDSWNDTPDSVMTLYFVFQEKFEELKAGGMRDLSGVKEGMLQGLPVG